MPFTHTESTQRGARFRSRAPYPTLGSWASAERYPQRVFCRLWAQALAVPFGGGVMECNLVRHETCTETYVQTEEQADRLRSVDACLVRSGGACPTGTECCDDPSPLQSTFPCENRRDERFWQQHQQHHSALRSITLVLNVDSSLVITKGGFVFRNESII